MSGPGRETQRARLISRPLPIELRFVKKQDADPDLSVPEWLAEVREMRGRFMYDNGHRPSFRKADGRFEDSDSIDLSSYHVVARYEGRVAGCVRVAPFTEVRSGVVSSAIGEERLTNTLRELGTSREKSCESSRWVILPEHRGELGLRLVAAIWAITRWWSMNFCLVMAGTRLKQDLILIRMGARPVKGCPTVLSELLDDELRLLYFDVGQPPLFMQRRIEEAADLLNLRGAGS